MCLLDAVAWMAASGCTRQDHFSQCLCQTLRCLRLPARTAAKSEKYPGRQAVLEWFSLSSRKAPYCGVLARCHWQACSFMLNMLVHETEEHSHKPPEQPARCRNALQQFLQQNLANASCISSRGFTTFGTSMPIASMWRAIDSTVKIA
ncbi:hypothetical protein GQ600_23087 [Phytophthora cactorum]|nr:hypothetical protein GQ600_23087 [Phytophthora cactorum]